MKWRTGVKRHLTNTRCCWEQQIRACLAMSSVVSLQRWALSDHNLQVPRLYTTAQLWLNWPVISRTCEHNAFWTYRYRVLKGSAKLWQAFWFMFTSAPPAWIWELECCMLVQILRWVRTKFKELPSRCSFRCLYNLINKRAYEAISVFVLVCIRMIMMRNQSIARSCFCWLRLYISIYFHSPAFDSIS
jgi:hypothetical protein